jgi:hypothetical protein
MSCRNHPQVESGLDHCYRCGFRFCEECRVEFQGKQHCASCKAEAVSLLESGHDAGTGVGGGELPPWERRLELGLASAFWATVKQVMGDPAGFFRRMDKSVTTWDCLAVPCVLSLIGAIVSAIVQIAFAGVLAGFISSQGGLDDPQAGAEMFGQMFGGAFGACFGVFLAPVFAIIFAFIFAGLIHLYLHMTNNVGEPYHQTLRGYCYAQAPTILGIIPILGGIVGWFWSIWTTVVMVKELHRTTWGTAWISVLWYIVLLCLFCGGAYAALIAFAISMQN